MFGKYRGGRKKYWPTSLVEKIRNRKREKAEKMKEKRRKMEEKWTLKWKG
jgi:hypothetical protein